MAYYISPLSGSFDEDGAGTQYYTIGRTVGGFQETVYVSTLQNWNGSGIYNNGDYGGLDTVPVTFASWEYLKSNVVGIPITPDTIVESNETFGIIVENSFGSTLASTSFTILNDDTAVPQKPDLDAQNSGQSFPPSLSATSVVMGDNVTLTYRASNWGPGGAPSSFSGIYRSGDSIITTQDSRLLLDYVAGLGANTGSTETVTFSTSGWAPGTYYIGAVVDYNNAIAETNESNNPSSGVRLTVAAPAPSDTIGETTGTTTASLAIGTKDGKIDALGMDGQAGDNDVYKVTLTAGHNYTFSATANVSSNDSLDEIFIRLYDKNGTAFSPDIKSEGATTNFSYTPSTSGTYYFAISANGSGASWKAKTGDYQITLTENGAANQAPTVTGTSSVNMEVGQSFGFTSLISGSDPDGSVASYEFWDSTPGAGYLTLDGSQISGNSVTVSASQMNRVGYYTGSSAGNNDIDIRAIDNDGLSSGPFIMSINVTGVANNKPAATWVASPNYFDRSRLADDINYIVIHTTEGDTAQSTISWLQNPSSQVSYNYLVDNNGSLFQLVADEDIAWHAGNFNTNSIGIGHVGRASDPNGWTNAEYITSAQLTAWLSQQYSIPVDRAHIRAHSDVSSQKSDPGAYFDWNYYFGLVNSYIDGTAPPPAPSDTIGETTGTTTASLAIGTKDGKIDALGMDGQAGDNDVYKVTLTAGHNYTFSATANVSSNDSLDEIFIRLYDKNGTAFSPDIKSEGATTNFSYTPSTSGTYYFAISANGSGASWKAKTGDYQITLTENGVTPPPPASSDTVENDISTRTTLGVGQTEIGTIDQDDLDGNYIDKDYYKVVLTAGQSYTFSADANLSTTDTLDQVFIRLRDANGNAITSSASAEGATPSFTYDVPGSGAQTYYLAISAGGSDPWWDKTGDFSLSLTDNGVVAVANQTPYAQGSSATVAPGESVPLTDLFTYGDRDGLSDIVSFAVQDRTFDGGYLTFKGVEMAANTVFERPISELDQWAFTAGADGSDTIGFNAIDSQNAFNNSVIATVAVQTTSTPAQQSASELFAAAGGKMTAMAEFALAAYIGDDTLNKIKSYGWDIIPQESGDYYIYGNPINFLAGVATAITAESPDGKSLVIAFTGTDDLSDWFNNVTGITKQYNLYNNLFDSLDLAKYENIYVTGHSLGASMAQKLMLDPSYNFSNDSRVEAVTFANPGYGGGLVLPQTNRMVNVSINNDPVAEVGLDTRVAGDRYWIDPIFPNILDVRTLHDMNLYLEVAKYIDKSGIGKNTILPLQNNNSDDEWWVDANIGGNEVDGYYAYGPMGATYTPIETIQLEIADAATPAVQAVYTGLGIAKDLTVGTGQLIVSAPDKLATALEFGADVGEVAISAYIDSTKYLVNKAIGFSSLLIKAGDAAFEAIINPLDGTDITQNTVYFEGGLSDDVLNGTAADRRLVADGGAGDDTLTGGLMGDDLTGGAGNDNIQGGFGADFIRDALGEDILDGGEGHDQIILFSGTNVALGGAGNDSITGGIQGDQLFGDAGNDVIRGDIGSFGGADVINGGTGNDIMMGGVGADVFVFTTNDGADTIAAFNAADVAFDPATGYSATPAGADFEVGVDRVQLEGFATVNATNVTGFISSTAQGALFSAEGTDITFLGVDAATLTADDFTFL